MLAAQAHRERQLAAFVDGLGVGHQQLGGLRRTDVHDRSRRGLFPGRYRRVGRVGERDRERLVRLDHVVAQHRNPDCLRLLARLEGERAGCRGVVRPRRSSPVGGRAGHRDQVPALDGQGHGELEGEVVLVPLRVLDRQRRPRVVVPYREYEVGRIGLEERIAEVFPMDGECLHGFINAAQGARSGHTQTISYHVGTLYSLGGSVGDG